VCVACVCRGLNANFVLQFILGAGETWNSALGATFVAGVGYLIIVVGLQVGVGELFFFGLPQHFRIAIGVGIGLFLGFLGLMLGSGIGFAGISGGALGLPEEVRYQFWVAIAGLLLIVLLLHFKWSSAYILCVLAVTVASIVIRAIRGETLIAADAFGHYDMSPIAGQLNFKFLGGGQTAMVCVCLVCAKLFDVMGTVLTLAAGVVIDARQNVWYVRRHTRAVS
jgi:xanthine/uracil/vitamin C permease (AzgA family)